MCSIKTNCHYILINIKQDLTQNNLHTCSSAMRQTNSHPWCEYLLTTLHHKRMQCYGFQAHYLCLRCLLLHSSSISVSIATVEAYFLYHLTFYTVTKCLLKVSRCMHSDVCMTLTEIYQHTVNGVSVMTQRLRKLM